KGFSQLMKGDVGGVRELTEKDVAGIETKGGSILFTSRANPTKKSEDMQAVVAALRSLGVTDLVTLGGDDTATSATKVAAAAGGGMRAVHVPKTIDNDLPLPGNAPTFGFETAKHWGSELCKNLRVDAQTTSRWYLITAMGRSAGHLALSMAVGSGSQLCVIPRSSPRARSASPRSRTSWRPPSRSARPRAPTGASSCSPRACWTAWTRRSSPPSSRWSTTSTTTRA